MEKIREIYTKNPSKIAWGTDYKNWDKDKKLEYLEKFAHSMNSAAGKLQQERDELFSQCEQKERRIEQLVGQMRQQSETLAIEITRMNEFKNSTLAEISKLKQTIRDLKNGSND